MPAYTDQVRAEIRALHEQGMSPGQIGQSLQIHSGHVARHLQAMGLWGRPVLTDMDDEVIRMVLGQGLAAAEAADIAKMSVSEVDDVMERYWSLHPEDRPGAADGLSKPAQDCRWVVSVEPQDDETLLLRFLTCGVYGQQEYHRAEIEDAWVSPALSTVEWLSQHGVFAVHATGPDSAPLLTLPVLPGTVGQAQRVLVEAVTS